MKRWFLILCALTVSLQAAYSAVRVLVSYRALALGGDALTIGVITALFSLVPLLVAIPVGRTVDRRHAVAVLRVGVGLTVLAAFLIAISSDLVVLTIGNIALGFAQLLATVSAQGYISLVSDQENLDRRFAGWSLSTSIGQSIGLPIVGLVAAASSAHGTVATTPALAAMIVLVLLTSPLVFTLRDRPTSTEHSTEEDEHQSVITMLTIPGMRSAMFSSLIVLTSIDLLSAYLPVLGQEFGFSVLLVTALLTVRTGASMVSRALMPLLLRLVPRRWLLVSATLCSAGPMAAMTLTREPELMGLLLAAAGFFWGIGQPLTMTWVVGLVSHSNRASALSIRLTANRLGQVLVPLGAGVAAGATGVASVFLVTGGLLWASAGLTWRAVRSAPE